MVIGNGFFSNTLQEALAEMSARSGGEVQPVPFPTIGNITYYATTTGSVYGVQKIGERYISRLKKPCKNGRYICVRLNKAPHKETYTPMLRVMYCTFIAKQWTDEPIIAKDGNVNNWQLENITKDTFSDLNMKLHDNTCLFSKVYSTSFTRVAWHCNYVTGIDFEDAKDVTSQTFIYLCENNKAIGTDTEYFLKTWFTLSAKRAYDFLDHRNRNVFADDDHPLERIMPKSSQHPCEVNLLAPLTGERTLRFMRMYSLGHTTADIAELCHTTRSNVASVITRSIQKLQKVYG